ncbi:MAG: lipopolysaccharide biosynthesis protein [Hyphomicrobiales bacterium]|nr:lipopolysaccharide biosynthesis protein [Hyphomicrobiales bacterium]
MSGESREFDDNDEIDLGEAARTVASRRWWVIGPTALALLASTAFVTIVKPRYTAEARLIMEQQNSFSPRADKSDANATQQLDAEAVGSQLQVLQSRDLARRVIRDAGLMGKSEFDPLADGVGALTRFLVAAGVKRDPTSLSPEDRVLEKYFENLTVLSPSKTRVLNVEFQSRDPDLAAKIANTIADDYIAFQQAAKREQAKIAAASLGALVGDLKTRVAQAEANAEDFRSRAGLLVGSNNTTINAQQLSDVNAELARARNQQADALAKARLLREKAQAGQIGEIAEVANNDLVRRLSEQRASVRAQIALESRTLLPGHPRMQELNAQLADLERQLRDAAVKAARTLEGEAKVAAARVDNLQAALAAQKKVIGASNADEVQMRDLDRSARLLKDELEAASAKYQDAVATQNSAATPADARVISRALAPSLPTFPKKVPTIAFSTLAAFVLSLGVILTQRLMSRRVEPRRIAPRPAPVAVGAPVIVAEAVESAAPRHAGGVSDAQVAAAAERAAENVNAARPSRGGALALVARDDENDHGFALALGRALSRHGRAVLAVMDGGARAPHPVDHGLAEILAGQSSFFDAIHRDPMSRLHFIGPGECDYSGEKLGVSLDALIATYDFVIVAAPRTLDPFEAQALAERAAFAAVAGIAPAHAQAIADALSSAGVPRVEVFDLADESAVSAA